MKTFDQIIELNATDLNLEIKKAEHELMGVRMGIIAGQEKDSSKKKKLSRYIARLRTAKRQQEISLSQA